VDDAARDRGRHQALDRVSEPWIVDVDRLRSDEDELVDVLALRIRGKVAPDQFVALLRLRVRGELALAREVEERHDRRHTEEERDDPRAHGQPRPARARTGDALGREVQGPSYSPEPESSRLAMSGMAADAPKARKRAFGEEGFSRGRGMRTSHPNVRW
jgi:hypothetical protein